MLSLSEVVEALIRKLDDEEPQVAEAAVAALTSIGDPCIPQLIEALSWAPRLPREGVLRVLSGLKMPEAEIVGPVRREMEAAYGLVAEQAALEALEESSARDFLLDGLRADLAARLRAIFRLLRAVGLGSEILLIEKGLRSKDRRLMALAVEGMEKVIQADIGRLLVPLVDEVPLWERLAAGAKAFEVEPPSLEALIRSFLDSGDPVRQIGACALIVERGENDWWAEPLGRLVREAPPPVASQARLSRGERGVMDTALTTLEKVLFLRKVDLFRDLDVRALTAIATIAEERSVEPGEFLFREGDQGDSMFFVVAGTVAVLKDGPEGTTVELAEIGPPEVLGEMALFEDEPRSATLCTRQETTLLVISRDGFQEIMHEYPQVGASASRILSQRLRRVEERESLLRALVTSEERRGYSRVRADLAATREGAHPVRLLNLSKGGAYLVEEEPSSPGQRVSLTVELPGHGALILEGAVQRSELISEADGFGAAVVFEELSEEAAEALERWVAKHQTGIP